jgi:mannose-1-phosphate guanylyltransferase
LPESTNSSISDHLWAVVLAGGVGSRFWPVSTPARPKQILPLASEQPLIAETVERIRPLVPLERVRILTGEEYVDPIRKAVDGLQKEHFLVEPRARGTAPVLVWAAHSLAAEDPDAIMVSLHADHVIRPESAFRDLVATGAAAAARHDRLFTMGIRPTRPETGYGYVRRGPALDEDGAYTVESFVEKPGLDVARQYLASGDYLWNSGIFVWRAARLLDEVRAVTPELAGLLPLLDAGDPAEYFAVAPRLSIDEGVLERSGRVGVVDATFEWDDVGTWDAVGRTRTADERDNVVEGFAALVESDGCVVWNEGTGPIVGFGVRDLVIVRAGGVTLVLPRERAGDLKTLLDALPPGIREVEP